MYGSAEAQTRRENNRDLMTVSGILDIAPGVDHFSVQ